MTDGKLLEPLRDTPLPPSGVDLHRAVRDGRRRIRHRRIAASATAGLAVVALVATAPTLLDPRDRPAPPPVAALPTATAAPTAAAPLPDRAPTAFDPARQYADLGWLPAGLTDRTVVTGPTRLTMYAASPPQVVGEGMRLMLRMVPRGHDIALADDDFFDRPAGSVGTAGLTAAEPVAGRPAWWNSLPVVGRGAALRWQYAPGAWAEVGLINVPDGTDPQALVRRIALDIRYAVDRPVRLPVAFRTLPSALKPMSFQVTTRSGGGWDARLAYGAGKRTKYGDWPLTVQLMPRTSEKGDGSVLADPDSTLDGHPARRRTSGAGGASLQVYNAQGLYLELTANDGATLRALGGDLDELFRGAVLRPKVADWR
ncbi:hypothetical protein [Micromonospora mirobrigensis]|uniref:Uncharacterized protein n=1 Tax=Micromonospora mirobrigensis TaxID=262898 RepID=A0A1C4VLB9_9ACTN|nr:hypothetical protein [Micromonospora mirobrigensis]SCE84605.1 hypothetical protein GA0070564_1011280 [Micromonospora mirobrigensis]